VRELKFILRGSPSGDSGADFRGDFSGFSLIQVSSVQYLMRLLPPFGSSCSNALTQGIRKLHRLPPAAALLTLQIPKFPFQGTMSSVDELSQSTLPISRSAPQESRLSNLAHALHADRDKNNAALTVSDKKRGFAGFDA
jgi:hypothetical protein